MTGLYRMLSILKSWASYIALAAVSAWAFYLSERIDELEAANTRLEASIRAYEEASVRSDTVMAEWITGRREFEERKLRLQGDLYNMPEWDSSELPADYLRVLREAGVVCTIRPSDASDGSADGSSGAADEGKHK